MCQLKQFLLVEFCQSCLNNQETSPSGIPYSFALRNERAQLFYNYTALQWLLMLLFVVLIPHLLMIRCSIYLLLKNFLLTPSIHQQMVDLLFVKIGHTSYHCFQWFPFFYLSFAWLFGVYCSFQPLLL